jgi:hypothetical protein
LAPPARYRLTFFTVPGCSVSAISVAWQIATAGDGKYRGCTFGVWAIALFALSAFAGSSNAQEKSLKDQLVGTWIYVRVRLSVVTAATLNGPSLRGAATYIDNMVWPT